MQQADEQDLRTADTSDVTRVWLKTPPRVPRFVVSVALLSGMALVVMVGDSALNVAGWLGVAAVAAAGVMIPLLIVATREPPPTPVVELGFDRLRLPRTAEMAEQIVLTYREIDALFLNSGRGGFLWVGTESNVFMYPTRAFQRPEDADQLYADIKARIAARLPDGPSRLAAFASASSSALAAYRRPVPATVIMVVLIAAGAIMGLQLLTPEVFNVVHLGALVPSLVLEHGQWWRIGAAPWFSPADGLIAGVTVGMFGTMVERLFGSAHVVVVAAAAIGVGSALTLGSPSVGFGATPVAVAMFTAIAFVAQSRPDSLPIGFRPPGIWWIAVGLFIATLGLLVSEQDAPMLIGGAIAGVVVTALRLGERASLPLPSPSPLGLRLVALASVVVTGACIAQGALNLQNPPSFEKTALLRAAMDQGWGNSLRWNGMAWSVALLQDPAPEDLEVAAVLAERAVRSADDLPPRVQKSARLAFADTLATVRYRQGRYDDAIATEREVLTAEGNVTSATQLARFLDKRATTGSSTVTAGLPRIELTYNESRGFGVVLGEAVTAPQIVWAVIKTGDRVQGLLRFSIGPESPVNKPLWLAQKGTKGDWPADVRMLVADVQPGSAEWIGWKADPEFLDYP